MEEELFFVSDNVSVDVGESDDNSDDINLSSMVSSDVSTGKLSSTTLSNSRISFQCRSFNASLDNVSSAGNVASKF